MPTYVALLRGINVGGKNLLPMKRLLCANFSSWRRRDAAQGKPGSLAEHLTTPDTLPPAHHCMGIVSILKMAGKDVLGTTA